MLMHGKPCLIPILKHDLIQSSNILAGLMRLVLVIWHAIKSTFDQASGKSAPGAIGLTRGVFVSLETVTEVTGDRCFISIYGSYTSEIRLAVLQFKFCPTIYKTNPGKDESSEYGIFSKAVKFTLWINIVSHCKIIQWKCDDTSLTLIFCKMDEEMDSYDHSQERGILKSKPISHSKFLTN